MSAPCLTGKGLSILILQGVLQGVLKDILDSWEESRDDFWLQEWQVKTLIKLSEKLQASWCTGRGKSPMILHSVPQGVFENILDSWMDPRWLSMSRMTCIKLRKLCAKFQFPPCTGRGHSPGSLQSVLQGVLEDILYFWIKSRWLWMSRIRCINIKEALYKISGPLEHWKRTFSYQSPERPPRSLGGRSWFLNGG